jgi:hypothetical protein
MVNVFIAFFVGFIAIVLIYLFLTTLFHWHGADTNSININVDQISKSNVCNYDLANFLRMKDDFGMTYAERLAYDKDFAKKAEEFFNKNYVRGSSASQSWKIEVTTADLTPITTFGNITTKFDEADTCKQIIPRNDGSTVIVKLGVDY